MSNIATNQVDLAVISGRHSGVRQQLANGTYIVGSALEADIVLTDEGIEPKHFIIELSIKAARIEALAGHVIVEDKHLTAGESVVLRYPVSVSVHDVEMSYARPAPPSFTDKFKAILPDDRRLLAATTLGIFTLGAVGIYSFFVDNSHTPERAAPLDLQRFANETSGNQTKTPAPQPSVSAVVAAQTFQDRLFSSNLRTVVVSADSGVVMAKGFVEPANTETWRSAQMWFDQTYGPKLMLMSEVAITAKKVESSPISLQSVWAGTSPYVIDTRGDKYFEGSMLKNGWVIERIEQDKVTLRKASELLTVRL